MPALESRDGAEAIVAAGWVAGAVVAAGLEAVEATGWVVAAGLEAVDAAGCVAGVRWSRPG